MPTSYRILGQQNPGTTWTTLYNTSTSPATSSVLSTIAVCNTSTTARTFRLATVTSNITPTAPNCIAFDTTVPANETVLITLGTTLGPGHYIKAYGSTTDVTFTAFGAEIT